MNQLVCAGAADVDVDGVRQSLSLSACIHLLDSSLFTASSPPLFSFPSLSFSSLHSTLVSLSASYFSSYHVLLLVRPVLFD